MIIRLEGLSFAECELVYSVYFHVSFAVHSGTLETMRTFGTTHGWNPDKCTDRPPLFYCILLLIYLATCYE